MSIPACATRVGWQRSLVLLVTALPGIQRLLQIVVVEALFGVGELGKFANDLAVIGIIGMFTAVGWSSLIMTRVPLRRGYRRLQVALGLTGYAMLSTLMGGAALWILGAIDLVFYPLPAIVLLFSWSGYQLVRHFGLAKKAYHTLLFMEVGTLVCTILLLAVWHDNLGEVYLVFSLPWGILFLAAIIMAGVMLRRRRVRYCVVQRRTTLTGLEFGLTNFASGGMPMLLVPLATQTAGAAYAGLMGLLSAYLAVLQLFPRAISVENMPGMAQTAQLRRVQEIRGLLQQLKTRIGFITLAAVVVAGAAWLGLGSLFYSTLFYLPYSTALFGLLMLHFALTQIAIADANYLAVIERSRTLLQINLFALALFSLLTGAVLLLKAPEVVGLGLILLSMLGVTAWRNNRLSWQVQTILAGYQ